MTKIRIISGTYGYRKDGRTTVIPVQAGTASDTIEVSDEEARRLIERGVAELFVEAPIPSVATDHTGEDDDDAGGNTSDTNTASPASLEGIYVPDTLEIVDSHFTQESLGELTVSVLAKLAEDLGLDVKSLKKKDELVAAIAKLELEVTDVDDPQGGEDEDDPEAPPALSAEDPE